MEIDDKHGETQDCLKCLLLQRRKGLFRKK